MDGKLPVCAKEAITGRRRPVRLRLRCRFFWIDSMQEFCCNFSVTQCAKKKSGRLCPSGCTRITKTLLLPNLHCPSVLLLLLCAFTTDFARAASGDEHWD